jgi:hypothetical protein
MEIVWLYSIKYLVVFLFNKESNSICIISRPMYMGLYFFFERRNWKSTYIEARTIFLYFPTKNNTKAPCYLSRKWKGIWTQDLERLNSAEVYANFCYGCCSVKWKWLIVKRNRGLYVLCIRDEPLKPGMWNRAEWYFISACREIV